MMRATDFHSSFTILLSSSPKSSTMANTAWSTIAGCYVDEENQLENYILLRSTVVRVDLTFVPGSFVSRPTSLGPLSGKVFLIVQVM